MGTKSRDNLANLRPVGTGPYKIVDFKPGDLVRAEAHAGRTGSPINRVAQLLRWAWRGRTVPRVSSGT